MKKGVLAWIIAMILSIVMMFSCKSKEYVDCSGDYQLDVYQDSVIVRDGERIVGTLQYNEHSSLDSLINSDNQ